MVPPSKLYTAREYSNGVILNIPGKTNSPLLVPSANAAFPSSARFVTQDRWYITCSGSASNEGMIAHGPDGTTYRFDRYQSTGYPNMGYPASIGHSEGGGSWSGANLSRQKDELLVTEVTDVHGNWVRYNYDSYGRLSQIYSNDSRSITLAYSGSSKLVSSVTANGRTWRYDYETALVFESTDDIARAYQQSWLRRVTLPDNTTWEFQMADTLLNPAKGFNCSQGGLLGGVASVTHPSGVTGTFVLSERRHRLGNATDVQMSGCFPDIVGMPQADDVYPQVAETMAVTSKTLSGPDLTTMTWTYEYEEDVNWARGSDGLPIPPTQNDPTNWTKVIDPNGRELTYYHYWNQYISLGGQLAKTELRDSASGNLVEVVDYTYQVVGSTGTNAIPGFQTTLSPASQKVPVAQAQVSRQIHESNGTDTYNQRFTYNTDASNSNFSYGYPVKEEHWSVLNGTASSTRTIDTTYQHNQSQWVLGLPDTVRFNGTLIEDYHFDGSARLTAYDRFGVRWRTFGYHADGTLAWMRDALNRQTSFSSYKRGIARSVTRADGEVLTASVDNNGWVSASTNAKGQTTSITRNDMGWITAINRPAGLPDVSVTYQNLGSGITQTTTDGLLRTVSQLDGFYRPLTVTQSAVDGSDVSRQRFEYDFNGQTTFESFPTTTSNPQDGLVQSYDSLGRLLSSAERVAGVIVSTNSIGYRAGNQTVETNPLGVTSTTTRIGYASPGDGNITAIDSPEGIKTRFSYDSFGNLLTMRQYGNVGYSVDKTQRWSYDSRQRVCRHYAAETGSTLYGYNNANELTAYVEGQSGSNGCTTLPSTGRVTLAYNSLGQNTSVSYPDSTTSKAYDESGNLTSLSRNGSTWTYTYSAVDQLLSEQLTIAGDNRTFTTSHEYDGYNHQIATTFPSGRRVTFSPDERGRPTAARYGGLNYASNVSYHPNGFIASFNRANGRDFSQSLNARQLVNQISHEGAFTWSYQYDAAKQLTQISANESAFSRTMTYDDFGRLKTSAAPSHWGTASYNYDALGNLRTRAYSGRSVAINYDAQNRVSSYVDNGTTRSFSYDARGNVTQSGGLSLSHDFANQPTTISGTNREGQSVSAQFIYDGHQRRVKQTINGTTIYSVYGLHGQLIHRYNANTNTQTDYINLGNTTVAEVARVGSSDTIEYPYFDHLGSPVKMGNASGGFIQSEQAIFLPFGERWGTTNQASDERGYTGHIEDTELGLTYMEARYYDPVIGRFYANDPVGAIGHMRSANLQGFNRYAYANNNPYGFVDPDGADAVAIVFPDYVITVDGEQYRDLGHAGVLLIDNSSGLTKYYEFGRYNGTTGVVVNRRVSNVDIENGRPTAASLNKVLGEISGAAGHGGRVEGAYYDSDFAAMNHYARSLLGKLPDEGGYGEWGVYNSCNTFMQEVLERGGVDTPWMIDPRPTSYIRELQGDPSSQTVRWRGAPPSGTPTIRPPE